MSVKFVLDKVCNKLGYEGSLQLRWFRLEELTFWTILHSSTKPRPTTSKAHQQRENTCFMARSLSNHHLACALRSLPFHRARSMASYAVAAIATGSVCCSAPNSLPSVDAPPAGYLQNAQRFTYKYSVYLRYPTYIDDTDISDVLRGRRMPSLTLGLATAPWIGGKRKKEVCRTCV